MGSCDFGIYIGIQYYWSIYLISSKQIERHLKNKWLFYLVGYMKPTFTFLKSQQNNVYLVDKVSNDDLDLADP